MRHRIKQYKKGGTKMSVIGENVNINNVEELMGILNMCNKLKEEQQIHMLLEQMQEMETNYASVLQELASIKVKLNKMQLDNLSQTPAKMTEKEAYRDNVVQMSSIIQMETSANEVTHDITKKYHNLQNIGKNLNEGAKQVVRKFKEIGISALDNVCGFLGIKEKLIELRDDARSNEMKMKTSVEKIEKIESELNATMLHAKNVGRAMLGKNTLAETSGKKSKFFDMLKKPYLKHQAKYAGQCEKLNKAIEKFDSLEQAARNIRNRDSVRDKLEDNKKIIEFRSAEKDDMQQEKSEIQRDDCAR